MSNFPKCFDVLMRFEGEEFEDVPGDEGGPTKFGITLSRFQELFPEVTIEQLKAMAKGEAMTWYEEQYWIRYHLDEITSTDVASRLLLALVNLGPRRAVYAAQRACRATGHAIQEDGILGPVTFATLNQIHTAILIPALRSEVAGYYRRILDKDPTQEQFRAGWLARAYY